MKRLFKILFLLLIAGHSFAQETKSQLVTRFDVIRNETSQGGNTKTRIANAYQELSDGSIGVFPVTAIGTDTYTGSLVGLDAYTGRIVFITFPNNNTGASTLNINSIGANNIMKDVSGTWTALDADDILANKLYRLYNDGSRWQIDLGGSGGGLTPPIDATDIADGSVNDTEFQYINSLTSNAQTQIDGKQDEFTSQSAALVYASPGGTSGVPAFLSLTAEHLATLTTSRTLTSASALVQTDNLRKVYVNSASPFNLTADLLATGTEVTIINIGSATVTLIAGSGVTLPGGTVDIAAGSNAVIIYRIAATPDVYTGTAASGTVTSVGLTIGTSGSDVNVSGSPVTTSGSITLNIPDAGASARGVVTTGTQTFAGTKTITVANTPAGGIAATTVQTALNELDTEKENTANKATSFSTLNSTLFPTTQAVADELLFFKNITAVTGSSGVDASIKAATALDRIPTTSTGAVATGTNVAFISSGTHYIATLKAGTFAEAAPYIVRPNDYATTTNEKYWEINQPFQSIYLPQITAYLGSSGSDGSTWQATAVDRIPTTSMSVGTRITAIVTISGTQRRLYYAELVTPADATANIEVSPAVIRPNDFNASTNNKVWREIHMNGIIDVSNFGVVPDPSIFVSDQINAIISAASAGATLVFPPGDYKIFAISINKKLNLYGIGQPRFILSTVNAIHMTIDSDFTTVSGFTFIGQGRAHASYPLQGALKINNCSNVMVRNCIFDSMPAFGIQTNATHISDQSSDFGSIEINQCHFTRCAIGFNAGTRGEYVNIVNCGIVDNNIGLLIDAGNINIVGNNILDNSTVGIQFTNGENNAHGEVVGNQINHNAKSIIATGLTHGEFFRGNNIYYGDMEFTNSTGIEFFGNTIEALEMKFDSCYGKVMYNTLPGNGGVLSINLTWNGGVSDIYLFQNTDLDNDYVQAFNASTPRVLNSSITTTGNVGTGEDVIYTYTVPAALLNSDRDQLHATLSGRIGASGNNKTIKIKFGGEVLFSTGAVADASGSDWSAEVEIWRTAATTQKAIVRWHSNNTAITQQCDFTTPAQTLSGTVAFEVTGEATANNEVIFDMGEIRFRPHE